MGRDHHALFLLHRELDGRQKIGERLAHAGAGLDEQMMAFGERAFDGGGHLKLLRSRLVAIAEASGDGCALGEEVGGAGGWHSLGIADSIILSQIER